MISRRVLEMLTALLTGAFGLTVTISSLDNGIGWSSDGVDAGTFEDVTVNYSMSGNALLGSDYTLSGAATGLSAPIGLALDRMNDEIVVTNANGNSVTVYGRTASGDTPPLRTLTGASTGLNYPVSAYVDLADEELIVSNQNCEILRLVVFSDELSALPTTSPSVPF